VNLGRCDELRSTPNFAANRAGDPGVRSATRRARAISFKNARSPSLEHSDPRLAPSTQVERDARRAVTCGSWLAGPLCGNASWRPTQLASVGAGEQRSESPARVRGSNARRVCPCVVQGCRSRQAKPRLREARFPVAKGRADGGLARADPKGCARVKRRRQPASRWQNRDAGEGRSRALERALRGKGSCWMEGISDRSFTRLVHADAGKTVSAALTTTHRARATVSSVGEATGVSEVRSPRIATGRQGPPRWHASDRAAHRSESH